VVLDLAMKTGQPWFEFTAQNLPFPNQMTPQMAAADLDKKNQLAAANIAREKAAAAARAEAAARLAALPHADPIYAHKVAEYVQADALGWAMYHLEPGSVGNVRILSGTVKSGNFLLRAEYKYVGGSSGWVVVQYSEGKFNCIEFWDSMVGCRAIRKPGEGQERTAGLLGALMNGSSSSGSSGSSQDQDENTRWNMYVEKNRNEGLNDNGTQK
jgi:hypothetical protein